MNKYIAAFVLAMLVCAVASAHDLTAEECPAYSELARIAITARNTGISSADFVPAIMKLMVAQGSKFGVKDAEDIKRVMEFVRAVYGLDIPPGKHIDEDATVANVLHQCEVNTGMHDKPMTPDPSVPYKGNQIGA
jgi:hypothetical protein